MTFMEFWRHVVDQQDKRLVSVAPIGRFDGDTRDWVRVSWPWGKFNAIFPCDDGGVRFCLLQMTIIEERLVEARPADAEWAVTAEPCFARTAQRRSA